MRQERPVDYERAVEIAKGVFWVGFYDSQSGLHCNPYLIVDRDEAVVIDGGSRPDFPTVMMKILGREDLKIISAAANNMFIRHYAAKAKLLALENIGSQFVFSSLRAFQR